tara:strand:+ start:634 stop:1347 length:714 start_codon:yes stop_codon:yes gene_type:complete
MSKKENRKSIYEGKTEVEIEAIRAKERERWDRRKEESNRLRRIEYSNNRPEYPKDIVLDKDGNEIKNHRDSLKQRVDDKYGKWTEEQIHELGSRLHHYMVHNEDAVWWKDFFILDPKGWGQEQSFYSGLPETLSLRSNSFANFYERVKTIQASRLLRLGVSGGSKNTNFIEFLLINMTEFKSRNHKETTNNSINLNAPTRIELLPPSAGSNNSSPPVKDIEDYNDSFDDYEDIEDTE